MSSDNLLQTTQATAAVHSTTIDQILQRQASSDAKLDTINGYCAKSIE